MKNSIVIKSFQHGISLHLPKDGTMEELLDKIAFKFNNQYLEVYDKIRCENGFIIRRSRSFC